jgi:SRSO17 transposase
LHYLQGLLQQVERKNGWQLAERVGERSPDGIQRLLNAAKWDTHAVRGDLQAYVWEHLGSKQAVWVVDETGFLKKGSKSAGVQRQYSGTAGRVENCQVGVFLYHWNPEVEAGAFLDRELYLPKSWTDDTQKRQEAGIPDEVTLRTKGRLAQEMLARAFATGIRPAWVVGDSIYGSDRRLRLFLEEQEQPFVLGIKSDEPLWTFTERGPGQVRAAKLAVSVQEDAWQPLSVAQGSKGPRVFDWALVPLYRLGADAIPFKHALLLRRDLQDGELSFFVVFAPKEVTLEQLVEVAGMRWSIEMGFEEAKSLTGLDEYEVRKYVAWYRHITFSLLAHAFLNVIKLKGRSAEKGGLLT